MAARGLPARARVHYNLGMLLNFLGKDLEAEAALKHALELEPQNVDFLAALIDFYLKRGRFAVAKPLAERLAVLQPEGGAAARALAYINSRLADDSDASGKKREAR
jgi:tetratricopeptide (TPR) repeat protein